MALNEKQKRFVSEYLIDLNATQAAIRAGYSARTANEQGARLLAKVSVQEALQNGIQKRSARTEITQDRVLTEYAKLAFFDARKLFTEDGKPKDITEIDDDTAGALVGLDVQDVYEFNGNQKEFIGYLKKYKLADKLGALNSLAKHLGMLDGRGAQDGGAEQTEKTLALADVIRNPAEDRNIEDFDNEPTITIQPETETVL